MYDLPSRVGVRQCRVTEAAVRGEAPVAFVYGPGEADDRDQSEAVG